MIIFSAVALCATAKVRAGDGLSELIARYSHKILRQRHSNPRPSGRDPPSTVSSTVQPHRAQQHRLRLPPIAGDTAHSSGRRQPRPPPAGGQPARRRATRSCADSGHISSVRRGPRKKRPRRPKRLRRSKTAKPILLSFFFSAVSVAGRYLSTIVFIFLYSAYRNNSATLWDRCFGRTKNWRSRE